MDLICNYRCVVEYFIYEMFWCIPSINVSALQWGWKRFIVWRKRRSSADASKRFLCTSGEYKSHVRIIILSVFELKTSLSLQVDTAGLALIENKAVPAGDALYLQGSIGQVIISLYSSAVILVRHLICLYAESTAKQVRYNLPFEQMHAPVVGRVCVHNNASLSWHITCLKI